MRRHWKVSWLRGISIPIILGAVLTQTTIALAAAMNGKPTLTHAGFPTEPPGMIATTAPQGSMTVTYQEGRLSVRAERAPLAQLLQEVSRQTGVNFQGQSSMPQEVSVQFASLPLVDGLRRLLARINYLLLIERPQPEEPPRLQALVFARDATPPVGYFREPARTSSRKSAAAEELMQALADTDPSGRRWAVQQPGEQGEAQAFAHIRAALDDGDPRVRQAAVASLSQYGAIALEPLQSLLRHEQDDAVRLMGLQVLSQVAKGNEGTLALLGQMLADNDPHLRAVVVETLAMIGGPHATDALRAAARDRDPAVRMAALQALALDVGDVSSEAVIAGHLDDPEEAVRERAAALLERFTGVSEYDATRD